MMDTLQCGNLTAVGVVYMVITQQDRKYVFIFQLAYLWDRAVSTGPGAALL